MIERLTWGFDAICDGCDYSQFFDVHHEEWSRLMEDMRSYGWKSKKVDGQWAHFCIDCAKEDR